MDASLYHEKLAICIACCLGSAPSISGLGLLGHSHLCLAVVLGPLQPASSGARMCLSVRSQETQELTRAHNVVPTSLPPPPPLVPQVPSLAVPFLAISLPTHKAEPLYDSCCFMAFCCCWLLMLRLLLSGGEAADSSQDLKIAASIHESRAFRSAESLVAAFHDEAGALHDQALILTAPGSALMATSTSR